MIKFGDKIKVCIKITAYRLLYKLYEYRDYVAEKFNWLLKASNNNFLISIYNSENKEHIYRFLYKIILLFANKRVLIVYNYWQIALKYVK